MTLSFYRLDSLPLVVITTSKLPACNIPSKARSKGSQCKVEYEMKDRRCIFI